MAERIANKTHQLDEEGKDVYVTIGEVYQLLDNRRNITDQGKELQMQVHQLERLMLNSTSQSAGGGDDILVSIALAQKYVQLAKEFANHLHSASSTVHIQSLTIGQIASELPMIGGFGDLVAVYRGLLGEKVKFLQMQIAIIESHV